MKRHAATRIRPSYAVIVRAPGLLPMKYTLRELSGALDVSRAMLNDRCNFVLPNERDRLGLSGRRVGSCTLARPRLRSLAS